MITKRNKIMFIMSLILICIISLAVIYILNSKNIQYISSREMKYLEALTSLAIYVQIETVTRENMYIKLVNYTNHYYIYGESFNLLIRTGDRWKYMELPPLEERRAVFTLVGFVIEPYSHVLLFKDLKLHYGYLPDGEYRIIKSVYRWDEDKDITNGNAFRIVGSFIL